MMFNVDPAALNAERAQYAVIRSLVDKNDFNAIKYLSDRLNIIDAKVSSPPRMNVILFSAAALLFTNRGSTAVEWSQAFRAGRGNDALEVAEFTR